MGLTVVGCNPQGLSFHLFPIVYLFSTISDFKWININLDIVNGNTKQIMGIIFLLIQYTKHHKTDDEPNKLLIEISNFSKHLGTDLNLYLEKGILILTN